MSGLNPVWWQQPAMGPLQAVRVTVECLEHGDAVPTAAAAIVALALRQYLAGQTDITRSLGLRPRRGGSHETPLHLEQATQRNQSIQAIFAAMPGRSQSDRAEQTALLLSKPPAQHITEKDVFKHLVQLFESHAGTLPTSGRQILRIIKGQTVDARKR
jgi:hypothetical protein